jgi:site-specific DNA-methyltransferase (adenine-specific)
MNSSMIYNDSSAAMPEIADGSVNLIVTSPPYNLGTVYGHHNDRRSHQDYMQLLLAVISESHRVLSTDGTLIIEVADSLLSNRVYIQLAGLIQSIALAAGFHLVGRDFNLVLSQNQIERPEHGWAADYTTTIDAHSNAHQWLYFRKHPAPFEVGRVFYNNYESTQEHPCPYPMTTVKQLLDTHFHPGDVVLDPFMGTAGLGVEVIKRGGHFIGYEIDHKIFEVANQRLNSA